LVNYLRYGDMMTAEDSHSSVTFLVNTFRQQRTNTQQFLESVFSVRSMPRLYNEDKAESTVRQGQNGLKAFRVVTQ
jgi:hypothetical protein